MPRGVLLVNIGSPRYPTREAVKLYLDEFLMDPYVIDLPFLLRYPLVRWLITPKRSRSSAALYSLIWSDKGSPLIQHSFDLEKAVQTQLGEDYVVKIAMRYGVPSIATAIDHFRTQGVHKIIGLALYPQYSTAATQSAIATFKRHARGLTITWVKPFYRSPLFLDAFAREARKTMETFPFDRVLFSFHGLPRRQLSKLSEVCRFGACCDAIRPENEHCYRAQAFHTARAIAKKLNLKTSQFEVAFQSRLNARWITPFTDVRFQELPGEGVRHLLVICPSFVADCLETLEEVQIRGANLFTDHGGKSLRLVPSLNTNADWVRAVCEMVLNSTTSLNSPT